MAGGARGSAFDSISLAKAGSRKARVLPDPVFAMPIKSVPCTAMGQAYCWMSDGALKPASTSGLRSLEGNRTSAQEVHGFGADCDPRTSTSGASSAFAALPDWAVSPAHVPGAAIPCRHCEDIAGVASGSASRGDSMKVPSQSAAPACTGEFHGCVSQQPAVSNPDDCAVAVVLVSMALDSTPSLDCAASASGGAKVLGIFNPENAWSSLRKAELEMSSFCWKDKCE
mmetsp:Transcript_11012/g.25162  ORF Transcript_11012/g.25162 Transcript_11012/m.25162 type:complete len:227 (+) Transcript_11012:1203-1883(+)